MPKRKDPQAKIAELQEQERQIKARLQREKSRLRQSERKQDTRRKIIAGALALEHKDAAFQAQLNRLLDEYVTRPQDRALFGLEPLQETPSPDT
jgi:hypothetical protein